MASTAKIILGIGCVVLLGIGLLMVTCAGCVALFSNAAQDVREHPTAEPSVSMDDQVNAWHLCKQRILQRLRSPSTAEFIDDDRSDHHVFLKDTTKAEKKLSAKLSAKGLPVKYLLVQGEVDAQNGFGAKLRSNFECSIQRLGAGDNSTYVVTTTRIATR